MPLAVFGPLDWVVVGAYLALMVGIGAWAARRKTDAAGYFLAERQMPTFAVALSVVATSLSVATFNGAPQEGFDRDLTYLSSNIGGFIAVFIVAAIFIPRFYRAGTMTIYGYIEQRFGETAKIALSCMFLIGRLLASGARLFIAAIPLCLLIFHTTDPTPKQKIVAIVMIGMIGTAYTIAGGIRAVIWTDAAQITIVLGTVLISIALLLHHIPLSVEQIFHVLSQPPPGHDHGKLRLLDFSTSPSAEYTLWTALIGSTFLSTAAYGVDHDLAQRMLTARSAWRGSLSLIVAQCIGVVVVTLFLCAGLLLYIYYGRPDLMGTAAPTDALHGSMAVYPQYLLAHLPTGLAGVAIAGMFAAAQGSLDSAINAMASSAVADLYWPIRRRMGLTVGTDLKASRAAVAVTGAVLIGFAVLSAVRYDPKSRTLLAFALGVMTFAYTGMLGVFLTALLTRRGNTISVLAALVTGVVVTTLFQDSIAAWWTTRLHGAPIKIAIFWWMPIGTTAAFLVCAAGRRQRPDTAREVDRLN